MTAGSVTGPNRQSLREIWTGAALAAQRQALEVHDYGLGCQECGLARSTGRWDDAMAAHFDQFGPGAPHGWPLALDLALSNRCNLECVMCNGDLSSSIRARHDLPPLPSAYDDRFFAELDEFLPHLRRIQFKGGEPVLARENRRIWDRLIELDTRPEVAMTTNGTILNENVERYVTALRIHPIVSVDAMDADGLEAIRVGVHADQLWRNIDRYQELAASVGQPITLSICVMSTNWREFVPLLVEAERRGAFVTVALVNWPPQFDLLRLPHHELEAVRDHLAAEGARLRSASVIGIWQGIIDRLTGHLEFPVDLVKTVWRSGSGDGEGRVEAAPTGRPLLSEAAGEALIDRLRREVGVQPMVVSTEHGRVSAVDEEPWGAWLAPQAWLGSPVEALVGVIGDRLGPVHTARMPSADSEAWAVDVETDHGSRAFAIHRFDVEATGEQRLVVVPRAVQLERPVR